MPCLFSLLRHRHGVHAVAKTGWLRAIREHMPEVRRISKSRNAPKFVKKQTAVAQTQKESSRKKQENRIKHSRGIKEGAEREKTVARQID